DDHAKKALTSKRMKAIKSKDTKEEILLRNALWQKDYRYRKNNRSVFGTPDLTFKKQKVAIFVDSEFFHGFEWEINKLRFKNNSEFWIKKIERNIERDKEVNQKLKQEGWTVLRFWSSFVKKNTSDCISQIENVLNKPQSLGV